MQRYPGILSKQLRQSGPGNSGVSRYFVQGQLFAKSRFQQLNGAQYRGMFGRARPDMNRVRKSAHHVENEQVQSESKCSALVIQSGGRFFQHPSETALQMVSIVDREDR